MSSMVNREICRQEELFDEKFIIRENLPQDNPSLGANLVGSSLAKYL
jgi:hypothetical protein